MPDELFFSEAPTELWQSLRVILKYRAFFILHTLTTKKLHRPPI